MQDPRDWRAAAVALDDQGLRAEAVLGKPGAQTFEIACDGRERVGAQHGRRRAVPFAQLRQDVGTDHHRDARHFLRQDGAGPLLVRGIDLRPEEGDRHRVHPQLAEARRRRADIRLVQRIDLLTPVVDAPADTEAAVPGNERLRPRHPDVERLGLGPVHELQHVAKALGREQTRDGAVALDDGVGADRRAVNDAAALGDEGLLGTAQFLAGQRDPAQDALKGVLPVAQRLEDLDLAARFVGDGDVGEGATDVDADPVGHGLSSEQNITSVS